MLCGGELLASRTGEGCGAAVDRALCTCGTEVGRMPDVYAHVQKVYPFWLWEGGGKALRRCFCEVSCEFITLPAWEWCAAGFLCGSAQWLAPEMLSVAVKYILFLCFFKNVTALRSCNMTGCPNTINEMCFASFSMITIWDNLRDSERASGILIPS